ncbi:MAG: polyprenyl synthetase family protein [Candidatus Krumholzibacteriia bacterium]
MAELWRGHLAADRKLVDGALRRELRAVRGVPPRLRQAMTHSLFGGGKRLRPLLVLWTHDALARGPHRGDASRALALRAGAALEMIHTYSLIHDDLPAMDDDVLRRGRPTCHVAYDEGTAILAGDGLQALAFGVLADLGPRAAQMVGLVAAASGPAGMVGGQQRDLEAEGQPATARVVERIHAEKTAAMLAVSLALGAVCRGARPARVEGLREAGHWLGLAFQGADDVLDVTASSEVLGKTAGKDDASGKATWVRVEGIERASRRACRYGERGLDLLREQLVPGPESDRLLALCATLWQRKR